MSDYGKKYEELRRRLSEEEIAEGYLIPADLSDEEKEIAEREIKEYRLERLKNRTESERILSELTRLRLSINRYLESEVYSSDYSFGSVLKEMTTILRKTKKGIAEDLDVHYTRLSRIMNDREEPNLSLIYRLEKYSDRIIPAIYWWKLMIRKQEFLIHEDQKQRLIEGERVKNYLEFSA
jgi:plasmid maintenance system antidote protein VapI